MFNNEHQTSQLLQPTTLRHSTCNHLHPHPHPGTFANTNTVEDTVLKSRMPQTSLHTQPQLSCKPNNTGSMLDPRMEGFTDPVPACNSHVDRPTTVKLAPSMRSPQQHSTKLSETQRSTTNAEEACQALDVVIRFFQQQPNEYLDLDEGVLLGKLAVRLKDKCSAADRVVPSLSGGCPLPSIFVNGVQV